MNSQQSTFHLRWFRFINAAKAFVGVKLQRGLMRWTKQASSILLIICLLTISAPASPQVLIGSFTRLQQDVVLRIRLSNWLRDLSSFFYGGPSAPRPSETQEERNTKVERIEIETGNKDIYVGATAQFVAIPLDRNDVPVSGVRFDWEFKSPDGQIHFSEGLFSPDMAGDYKVTARGAGQEASITITVADPPNGGKLLETPQQELLPNFDEWDVENIPHAHNPQNDHGNTPGKPKGNSNFNINAPVLSLPGRGLDMELNLNYNSSVWSKLGQDVSYDMDKDWVAPGWTLGFGKVINLVAGGIVQVDAYGSRRFFGGQSTIGSSSVVFEGQSTDGGFVKTKTETSGVTFPSGPCYYNPTTYIKYPNGTTIWYDAWTRTNSSGCYTQTTPITMVPKTVTDRSGNQIVVTYYPDPAPGDPVGRLIKEIKDTLGRIYTFNYTLVSGRYLLTDVTGPGLRDSNGNVVQRTFVRLSYKDHAVVHNFSGLTPHLRAASVKVLQAIYYPATQSGYWFGDSDSYSPYGMIRTVREQKGMGSGAPNNITAGQLTRQRTYSYPTDIISPITDIPTFGDVTETWDGMTSPPPVTSYQVNWNANPRTTTVIGPDQSRVTEYSFNLSSLPDTDPQKNKDGIAFKSEFYDSNNQLAARVEVDWETGFLDVIRPKKVTNSEFENGITLTRSTVYDTYGEYNQVLQVRELGYGGDTDVIRKTVTAYTKKGDVPSNDNEWRALPRLINLPTQAEVFDANNVRLAYSKYEYDVNATQALSGANPPNFCADSYCTSITQRGNLSKITTYESASDLTGIISDNGLFDKTGNLVLYVPETTIAIQKAYKYSTQTAYAYVEEEMIGDTASIYSADLNMKSTLAYDINTGMVLSFTDRDLQTVLFSYDLQTWRATQSTSATGAYSRYVYDDLSLTYTQTDYDNSGITSGKIISRVNGLGLPYRQEGLSGIVNVNGQNQEMFDVVETEYDQLGRAKKTSNRFKSNESQHGVHWSESFYDTRGRTWKVVSPNGSTVQRFFNEAARPQGASTNPGQTVRRTDPVGRQKWYRQDADDNLVEVIEPNPDGDGSVAANGLVTKYTYDKLKRLTRTEQGSQERTFRYDSLGRVTHQKIAEAKATLDNNGLFVGEGSGQWTDVYTYNKLSGITSRTDARGVRTNFSYANSTFPQTPIDPLNRVSSISYDTNGAVDVLASPTVNFTYTTTGNLSKVKSVVTQGISTVEFDYDSFGRTKEKKTTLVSRPNNPLTINYLYDSLGRVTDVVYPTPYGFGSEARKTVHSNYDVDGRMNSLKVDGVDYASDFAFNANDQLTAVKIGPSGSNQIAETYDYSLQTGLLQNQKVMRGNTALLDLSYEYQNCLCTSGGSGQIKRITNNLDRNKDRSYEYDALGRLKKATGGINQTWSQAYAYDRYGNRTSVTSSGYEALRDPLAENRGLELQNENKSGSSTGLTPPTAKQLLTDVKSVVALEDDQKPDHPSPQPRPLPSNEQSERSASSAVPAAVNPNESGSKTAEGTTVSVSPPPSRKQFDFDLDNKADVSIWQKATGNWVVLQSGNNQTSQTQFGANGDQIAPADYDGDGKTDRAVWRPSTGYWYILRSSDNGVTSVQWGATGDAIVPADYDGDGKADIAVWRPSTGYWYILRSTDGGYSATLFGGQQYGDIPVPARYDNDLKADIAVWRPSTGHWYIMRSTDGQVIYPQFGQSGDVPVWSDYDGDNIADLAVWRPSNNYWYIQRSTDGGVTSAQWGATGDINVPADYDGDNKSDIAVWRPSNGYWYIIRTTDGGVTYQQFGVSGQLPVPSAYIRRSSAPKGQSVEIPRDGLPSLSFDAASNRITTTGFTYDYTGNQTRTVREDGTALRFQYDAAGRLAKVKNDSSQTIATYTYGSTRERLIVQEGNESSTNRTYYAWDNGAVFSEYVDSTSSTLLWNKNYIYMSGALLATHERIANSEKLQFDHPDQLGTRIVTDPGTGTSFEQNHLPFGGALNSESTGTTNRRFTSYDRSASTNLDYAVNRFYDSSQGRFTQVDPSRMSATSLGNPQTLNLYAYCAGDPINRTDPQGLDWNFSFSWPPGWHPDGGSPGGIGASIWAWFASLLQGLLGYLSSFHLPGFFVSPVNAFVYQSLTERYGLERSGTTEQVSGRRQENSMGAGPSQMKLELIWDTGDSISYGKDKENLIREAINKLLSDPCGLAFAKARNARGDQRDGGFHPGPKVTLKSTPEDLLYRSNGVVIAPASILLRKSAKDLGITEAARNNFLNRVWDRGLAGFTIRDIPGMGNQTTDGKVHIFLTSHAFDGTVTPWYEVLPHEFTHGGGQLPDSLATKPLSASRLTAFAVGLVAHDFTLFGPYQDIVDKCGK